MYDVPLVDSLRLTSFEAVTLRRGWRNPYPDCAAGELAEAKREHLLAERNARHAAAERAAASLAAAFQSSTRPLAADVALLRASQPQRAAPELPSVDANAALRTSERLRQRAVLVAEELARQQEASAFR